MEAPLRWLAEGYQLILYGFPSVPGLLYQTWKAPFPISRRRQLLLVRDCGVFATFPVDSCLFACFNRLSCASSGFRAAEIEKKK
ncbi:uncharacterized protein F4812DRAFT_431064 [Daldinia caldariorum]|uniref:uncharacterized protein n=1 Tax=Daldinia caldariorum TaxID=326644 RepID=UPI0020087CF2|nr:uncharacterized protein F4812DRAFT_431064 [Daldinia caldariorum]KAI1467072.1 hypothetical protein F4812DRAFT_431064 [Daldinia caldariorum]